MTDYKVRMNDQDRYIGSLDTLIPVLAEQYRPNDHMVVHAPFNQHFKFHGDLFHVVSELVNKHLLSADGVDGYLYQLIITEKVRPDRLDIKLAQRWVNRNGTPEEQKRFEEMVSKWQ